VAAACASCGAIVDVASEGYRILSTVSARRKILPAIELGTKGKLRGQAWQAIGFMRRFEPGYEEQFWDEYLLFNPYYGYRWLTRSYNGHWTLVRTYKAVPESAQGLVFQGRAYRKFHQGAAKVDYVLGEFYWQVEAGEAVRDMDAIAPPYMLSLEQSADEASWSVAEYIDRSEVAKAFALKGLPRPYGIHPCQPSPYFVGKLSDWAVAYALAVLVALGLQVLISAARPQAEVFSKQLSPAEVVEMASQPSRETSVGTLLLEGSPAAVGIELKAALSNSWLDAGVRLAPESGDAYEFDKELSYYSGYDEDGSWTENDSSASLVASAAPPGKYEVFLSLEGPPGLSSRPGSMSMVVTRNPPVWSNFWLVALLLACPLLLVLIANYAFESKRWRESELNPFPHGNE
jgi:hypothetical protein